MLFGGEEDEELRVKRRNTRNKVRNTWQKDRLAPAQ